MVNGNQMPCLVQGLVQCLVSGLVSNPVSNPVSVHGLVHGLVQGPVHGPVHGLVHSLTLILIIFVSTSHIACRVHMTEIYVDTVGLEMAYQMKLQYHFPGAIVTVTKKADSRFPIMSVASVCAKVMRDVFLGNEEVWGSGYPSDPRTSAWLKGVAMHKVFSWSSDQV